MFPAQQNSEREERDQDESQSALALSSHDARTQAEREFARVTAAEVDELELDAQCQFGDPDKPLFADYIVQAVNEMEATVTDMRELMEKTLDDHRGVKKQLSAELERRREELQQELNIQQEASLFGGDLTRDNKEPREELQFKYQNLQLLKKHAQTPLPDVLHDLDRQLEENLILMEQLHLEFQEPMDELLSIYRTLKNGNGSASNNSS